MNREIKFRAWDKHKKLFIPTNLWAIVQTDFGAFGAMLKDWENYKEGEYFYSNSQELSQFTGLHDKNGKYIYESDILFHHAHERKTVMKWVDGFCCFAGETIDDTVKGEYNYYQRIDQKSLEIIGNIYENPELL